MLKSMIMLVLVTVASAGYSYNFQQVHHSPVLHSLPTTTTPSPYQSFVPVVPQVQSYAPALPQQVQSYAPEPQIKFEHISRPRPAVPQVQQSYTPQVHHVPQVQSYVPVPQVHQNYAPVAPQVQQSYAPVVEEVRKPMIPIVSLSATSDDNGSYKVQHVGGDGTVSVEEGQQVGDGAVKGGSVQWTSPEGINFQLSYTADQNGFRVSGAHLPTPPPVTQEFQEALAVIQAKTAEHLSLVNAAAASNPQQSQHNVQQHNVQQFTSSYNTGRY